MTIKEQIKILDDKIKQNQADYDLYRQNAKISALPSGSSLIGNLLTGRGMHRAGNGNKCNCHQRKRMFRSGHGMYRAGQGIKKKSLISPKPHPLTNFKIIDYFKNEPRFNGVYSRNNLPKTIKNGAYVINLDEYENTGTHWVVLFVKSNKVTYFDSFGVEYIPKEVKKLIVDEDIKTNIFRIQAYNSIMCGYFCVLFIEFMFKIH